MMRNAPASDTRRLRRGLTLTFAALLAVAVAVPSPVHSARPASMATDATLSGLSASAFPARAPAGGWIVFERDGALYRIAPDGTGETRIGSTAIPLVEGETVAGRTVLTLSGSERPQIVNVEDGTTVTLDAPDGLRDELTSTQSERMRVQGGAILLNGGQDASRWSTLPVALTPDGRRAVSVRADGDQRALTLVDASTGQSRTVLTVQGPIALLKVDPTSRYLLVATGDPITLQPGEAFLIDIETGGQRLIPSGTDSGAMVIAAAFSPDGATLALSVLPDTVRVFSVHDLQLRREVAVRLNTWVAFTPDGSRIVANESDHGNRVKALGRDDASEDRPLVEGLTSDTSAYAVNADTLALVSGMTLLDVNLQLVRLDSTQTFRPSVYPAPSTKLLNLWLSASPAGDVWLFSYQTLQPRSITRTFLLRPDGSLMKQLAGQDEKPSVDPTMGRGSFSPDGRSLVFECARDNTALLCVADTTDMATPVRQLTTGAGPVWIR